MVFSISRLMLLVGACTTSLPCLGGPLVDAPLPPPRPVMAGEAPRTAAIVQPGAAAIPALPKAEAAAPASACMNWFAALPAHRVRKVPDSGASVSTAGARAGLPQDACLVVDAVVIEALSVRTPEGAAEIKLMPPPTVSCDLAKTFAEWLDTSLQPLARGSFGQNLTTLRVGGGHECRRRNRQAKTPVSEHSTGRALDIFAFQIGSAKEGLVSVEGPSGLVQTRFLTAVRSSACGTFSTTLGPGADAAHANHLHLDIQERRTSSTRFCQ